MGRSLFRRSLLESLGGFNPFLGMAGKKMAYGEETALLQRIRAKAKDKTVYYDPALFVHHLVQTRKMKLKWIIAHHFVSGRYAYLTLGEKRRFRAYRSMLRLRSRSRLWHSCSKLCVVSLVATAANIRTSRTTSMKEPADTSRAWVDIQNSLGASGRQQLLTSRLISFASAPHTYFTDSTEMASSFTAR